MSRGHRSARVLRLLLWPYPRRYRERFGAGMLYALERELDVARARGWLSTSAFWVRALATAMVFGALERVRRVDGAGASVRRGGGFDELWREARHAARRLVRRPGYALTALATLALGIGATTAIVSVIYGVIVRPLPYDDPDRLVVVGHWSPERELGVPATGYMHYADRSRTLVDLALYLESSSAIAGMGAPLELGIIAATPTLFSTLRVEPTLGRVFTEEDTRPGVAPVAVISHGYWQRQFGGDPAALGKPLFEESSVQVVGVLPPDFEFVRAPATVVFGRRMAVPDAYLPLVLDPARIFGGFGNFMYQGIGRLAAGASAEDASSELFGLMIEAAEAYPGGFTPAGLTEGGYRPRVTVLKDAVVGDVARVLWIVLGAVGFVLLIATANVANLFLVRAESRRGELAIRSALGAGGRSIARSFFAESVMLSLAGGALGVVIAASGLGALLRLAPSDIPRLDQVGVDSLVLGIAATVSILVGIAFGAAPLLGLRRGQVADALREEALTRTVVPARRRARQALVVSQVALSLVLLVASGLLLRTFANLRAVDPGFDGSRTLTLRLSTSPHILQTAGRTERGDLARTLFMLEVTRRIEAMAGVEAAAFSADLPLDGAEYHDYVAVEGEVPVDLQSATKALRTFIGPGYIAAIGGRILRGREMRAADFAEQPRTVLVNEAFARQRWPDGEALGRRIVQYAPGVDPTQDVWYTVAGVVADIREASLTQPPVPTVYLPTALLPEGGFGIPASSMVAIVRAQGDPLAIVPAVRDAIRGYHPEVPIYDVETLDQLMARSFRNVSFAMILLIIAAALSLALGVVGIYGTIAYVVGQRTREFGLRMVLGASGWSVGRAVLAQTSRVAAFGIGIGLVAALMFGRVLESLLFGVTAGDPAVFIGVALTLLAVILCAALIPALRAAAVDPAVALRAE